MAKHLLGCFPIRVSFYLTGQYRREYLTYPSIAILPQTIYINVPVQGARNI